MRRRIFPGETVVLVLREDFSGLKMSFGSRKENLSGCERTSRFEEPDFSGENALLVVRRWIRPSENERLILRDGFSRAITGLSPLRGGFVRVKRPSVPEEPDFSGENERFVFKFEIRAGQNRRFFTGRVFGLGKKAQPPGVSSTSRSSSEPRTSILRSWST